MNLESAGQPAVSEAELRLLGPVEVVLDGRLIDVGHARQLVVLAALAVEVNQPTPSDRLVDRVWGTARRSGRARPCRAICPACARRCDPRAWSSPIGPQATCSRLSRWPSTCSGSGRGGAGRLRRRHRGVPAAGPGPDVVARAGRRDGGTPMSRPGARRIEGERFAAQLGVPRWDFGWAGSEAGGRTGRRRRGAPVGRAARLPDDAGALPVWACRRCTRVLPRVPGPAGRRAGL